MKCSNCGKDLCYESEQERRLARIGEAVARKLDDTCLDCRWDDYDNEDNEDE